MTIRRGGARGASFAPAPALLLAGVAAEIVVGIAAVVRPPAGGLAMLGIATVTAIGSIVLVARSPLPRQVRIVVITLLCVLLLGMTAMQDPLGIRAVTRALPVEQPEDPLAASALAADDRPVVRAVTLRSANPDPDAQAAAAELAQLANAGVPSSDAEIDGTLTLTGPAAAPSYELNWSIVRTDQRLWCGRVTITAPSRAIALAQMQSRLAEALAQSRRGPLRCL